MADKKKRTLEPKEPKALKEPKVIRGGQATTSQPQTQSKNEVVTSESLPNESYYIHTKWAKASFLKNAIDAVKEIIVQTNMDWTDEGISIQGMDASHVALSNVYLSKIDCIFYHIKESITVGIDMIRLSKLLAMADGEDSLELFIKSDDEAIINMIIVSYDNKKRSHFQIPLLDIDSDSLNIPEMIYKGHVVQKSSEILSAIRDLGFFGDSVKIGIDNSELKVRVEGDFGKGERAWKDGILRTTSLDELQQSYPVKYMLMALKGNSVSSEVSIEMTQGSPIRISYSFGKASKIINYVAPKMDENAEY
jgi:proliferating cell nuclear antigen